MSIVGSWPIGMCCETDGATARRDGGAACCSDEQRRDAATASITSEQRGSRVSYRVSVYLPAPIRSSVASAITFVALTMSSMRQYSSG